MYCNCDDPVYSDFFTYFKLNFVHLGLKKIITTHYSKDIKEDPSYKIECVEYAIDKEGIPKVKKTFLSGNGDFRDEECIKLLKQSDIVCTNPPFSLFREYVKQLIDHEKKFLIIGNINAITYKEIFYLIKTKKIWAGFNFNKTMEFRIPKTYKNYCYIDDKNQKIGKVPGISWFTNLTHAKCNDNIILYKKYSKSEYEKYENFDAININKVSDIPKDYNGLMGVPITFLSKYSPDQFDIIALGITGSIDFNKNEKMEILKNGEPTGKFTINAKGTLYKKFDPQKDNKKYPSFKSLDGTNFYVSPYARIIIKRKT